jgi:integrase
VGEWCDTWLEGYKTRRSSTVRQAEVHITRIKKAFGSMPLGVVRPSHVKTWTSQLAAEGLEESYIYALHSRLSQLYTDAIEDGLVAKSPCSRRTSPPAGKPRPYVASEAQVWRLYEVFPEHLRAAVLVGAFMGARDGEACGLTIANLDLMRGIWHPTAQYPAEPLKTETSTTPVPFGQRLALELAAHIKATDPLRRGSWLLCNEWGQQLAPWTLQRAMRAARSAHMPGLDKAHARECSGCLVPGLPADFRFHDLRHYYASMLIKSGADVKVVQARLRHASAKTTLDTYGHLWPDSDDSTRAAIDNAMTARADYLRTEEAT